MLVRKSSGIGKLDKALRIGLEPLDNEHAELIFLLERFRNVHREAINSAVAGELIYVLGRAIFDHFATEERVMAGLAIPKTELQPHLDDHNRIIEEYVALQDKVLASPQTLIENIVDTVRGWVLAHIQEYDLKIRDYL